MLRTQVYDHRIRRLTVVDFMLTVEDEQGFGVNLSATH
jgi:hypothetical protein